MEQWLDWCKKHEKPLVAGMYAITLVFGTFLYCDGVNGGKFFDWIITPFAYSAYAMNWLCGC